MDTTATAPRLTATPIYPDTGSFPYVFVIREEDEDYFTAYGLQLLTEVLAGECSFCERDSANAYVEHGATGAPAVGVPVHVRCVLERGGVVARTADVTLVQAPGPKPRLLPTLDELNAALPSGCAAEWAYAPSVFWIRLPHTEARVLLTYAFNREDLGWEAVLETDDGDQEDLPDGPLVTYALNQDVVVAWAATVVEAVLEALSWV